MVRSHRCTKSRLITNEEGIGLQEETQVLPRYVSLEIVVRIAAIHTCLAFVPLLELTTSVAHCWADGLRRPEEYIFVQTAPWPLKEAAVEGAFAIYTVHSSVMFWTDVASYYRIPCTGPL